MPTRLDVGSTAPAFTLSCAAGGQVSLADYAGHRVILYFYPAAMTPGCTTQAVDFSAAAADLDVAGLTVIGVSPDPVEKLQKFQEKEGIAIKLLSDPDKAVHTAYSAFGIKKLYGKEVEGVIRSTFIIDVDADGVGVVALAQYNVKATGHVDRLRAKIGV